MKSILFFFLLLMIIPNTQHMKNQGGNSALFYKSPYPNKMKALPQKLETGINERPIKNKEAMVVKKYIAELPSQFIALIENNNP